MGILTTIGYVILAICVLLLMVLIHEFGHYCVGRWLGFKITEFSIGFGKAIFSKVNKRGEKISLRIFPLGGYCAFAGEGDDDELDDKDKNIEKNDAEKDKLDDKNNDSEKDTTIVKNDNNENGKTSDIVESTKEEKKVTKNEQTTEIIKQINDITEGKEKTDAKKVDHSGDFINQKPWKRLLVYMAGVTFNFLSAIIFSFILLLSYGYDIPRVATLDANYSNLYGELQEGDIIWGVNGTRISFAFSGTLSQLLSEAGPDTDITLDVERDNQRIQVVIRLSEETVTNEQGEEERRLVAGFSTEAYVHNFWEALGRSFELAFGFAWVVLKGFWQIITGQIAFSELGGSISTIGMMAGIMQSSFANFLILLPLLASNLAVFNFLPIPALDGGHAVFTLLEWIFRKPVVSRKVENYIHFYGLIILLLFVVVVDIVHIAVVGL